MKDDKVHIHNTIHVLGDLSLIVNRCCSRIFKLKTDKSAIFRLRKFFFPSSILVGEQSKIFKIYQ